LLSPRTFNFETVAEATPTSVIRDLSKLLNCAPEDILLGVHKDTRVKSANKFDVISKSKAILDRVNNNGVTINKRQVKRTLPTPRPPHLRLPPKFSHRSHNFPPKANSSCRRYHCSEVRLKNLWQHNHSNWRVVSMSETGHRETNHHQIRRGTFCCRLEDTGPKHSTNPSRGTANRN